MAAPQEIELKLQADAGLLDMLTEAPVLAGAGMIEKKQVSIYYDAPGQVLRGAGLSLRVRQIGDRHVQTVKAEGTATAGLFARPEWERDVPDGHPVIDETAGPLTTLVPEEALNALAAAFRVDVTRRTVLLRHGGGEIEVVIDRGHVAAAGHTSALAEVELELKAGSAEILFSLARALDAVVPLRLGVITKSERGYRLIKGREDKAVKSEAGILAGEVDAATAFERIAGACLRQFRLNEDILLRTEGAPALHQARVALRRLRSSLSIFKPMLADDRYEPLRGELRWLAGTLGNGRDIDVLLQRSPPDYQERLGAARIVAYAAIMSALASARARTLMIDLSEWIAIGTWRADPGDAAIAGRPAALFAGETLDRLRRRIKRRGRDLTAMGDEERHEIRILAKKLRYASEFFSGLFTGKKAARRTGPFLAALEKLQDHLGELNDIAHGPSVLDRLGIEAIPDPEAAAVRQMLLRKAAAAHEALIDVRPFWR